jgi:nitroimidazol reductase NimA-like FMN-containing flavoprotein (pyridoxamine 5'-phosphate oxidase superfamily)
MDSEVEVAGPRSEASRVKRVPNRASYEAAAVHAVLDAGFVAHVGLIGADGRPVVIPMLYGRDGDVLYLHGSVASRLVRALGKGVDVCVTVTHIDGLVLARSAFHHSMNYRSAVVLGRANVASGADQLHGLRVISEHVVPGRWDEVRAPNDEERKITSVLRLPIAEASAKVRTGGPIDDEGDMPLPIWAGVVPTTPVWSAPIADPDLVAGVPVSPAALGLVSRGA